MEGYLSILGCQGNCIFVSTAPFGAVDTARRINSRLQMRQVPLRALRFLVHEGGLCALVAAISIAGRSSLRCNRPARQAAFSRSDAHRHPKATSGSAG